MIVRVRTISGGRVDFAPTAANFGPGDVVEMLTTTDFLVVRDVHTGTWRVLRSTAVESVEPAPAPIAAAS